MDPAIHQTFEHLATQAWSGLGHFPDWRPSQLHFWSIKVLAASFNRQNVRVILGLRPDRVFVWKKIEKLF